MRTLAKIMLAIFIAGLALLAIPYVIIVLVFGGFFIEGIIAFAFLVVTVLELGSLLFTNEENNIHYDH